MDTCSPAPIGWPFPQPCHHNNYNPPPSAHYGNQVLFQTRPASSSFFFFGLLSPTHHHTSLHVSPAQTISRDFPSNPSPALAGACVSQVLPWKPGWLGTRPELSGTLSWLPLFSSCTPAKKKKKKKQIKTSLHVKEKGWCALKRAHVCTYKHTPNVSHQSYRTSLFPHQGAKTLSSQCVSLYYRNTSFPLQSTKRNEL